MKDINTKRPRRLDLDAPLLSTRRSNITSATSFELSRAGSLRSSSDRVPFSWEQSPGKPKPVIITARQSNNAVEGNNIVMPIPKPPLIRWQEEDDSTLTSHDNNNKADAKSPDAIDLFSLVESFSTSDTKLDFESETNGDSTDETWSPNFMIQRFLPAATALAASSLSALAAAKKDASNNNNKSKNHCSNDNNKFMAMYTSSNHFREGSRVAGEAYSSSRGCGFQNFFPWRAKHRLCGVKSPVRRVRSRSKPQLNPK